MRKLHVGCGTKFIEGYEHLDKFVKDDFVYYKCDAKAIPVEDYTYSEIYARHWLEHLYYYDAVITLDVLVKKLKKGGYFHFVVPNLEYHLKQLTMKGKSDFIRDTNFNHAIAGVYGWVEKGKEYMSHKYGYTKESLETLLVRFGLSIEWVDCRECDLEVKAYKR